MKKIFILALLFIISVFYNAQETNRFGITAKLHQSNIKGIHGKSIPRTGVGFGFFMQIELSTNKNWKTNQSLYLVPTLEYSMEGEEATSTFDSSKQLFYNDYVGLPILFKYCFGVSRIDENKQIFLILGPRFSYAIFQKTKGEINDPEEIKAEKSFRKFDFGGSAGLGFSFSKNFDVFVRGDFGVMPVYGDYKIHRTNNIQMGFGINVLF